MVIVVNVIYCLLQLATLNLLVCSGDHRPCVWMLVCGCTVRRKSHERVVLNLYSLRSQVYLFNGPTHAQKLIP